MIILLITKKESTPVHTGDTVEWVKWYEEQQVEQPPYEALQTEGQITDYPFIKHDFHGRVGGNLPLTHREDTDNLSKRGEEQQGLCGGIEKEQARSRGADVDKY